MKRPLTILESNELAEANRLILSTLADAEKTRTAECIHERNWRDDVSVAEALEMARHIAKVRNK